jgi:hypothetical protein
VPPERFVAVEALVAVEGVPDKVKDTFPVEPEAERVSPLELLELTK